jgi:phosphate transport system substrate-binding protein
VVGVIGIMVAACGSATPTRHTATRATAGGSGSSSSSVPVQARLAALESPPSAQVSLAETGSTLLYPLFNLWALVYEKLHPNVSITAAGTGSGTGIAQAAAGTVQIGASDAYLSPGQVQQYPGLMNVPLAISAQMINYNLPGFAGTLRLNGKLLSAIYQGQITMWNDPRIQAVNPGVQLPAVRIVALHRSDGSGDTFLFTQYLSKQDPSGWGQRIGYGTTVAFPAISNALGENGNGGMVSGCARTPGCVAYIGVSYESQVQAKRLGIAELENGAGNYVRIDAQSIAAEAAAFAGNTPASGAVSLVDATNAPAGWPIINYEYAIVQAHQPNPTVAQAIRALLAWALDPSGGSASSFLSEVNFQPLPPSAVEVAIALIQRIQ